VDVPEKWVPHFKAGKELRERVDGSMELIRRWLDGIDLSVLVWRFAGGNASCRPFPVRR